MTLRPLLTKGLPFSLVAHDCAPNVTLPQKNPICNPFAPRHLPSCFLGLNGLPRPDTHISAFEVDRSTQLEKSPKPSIDCPSMPRVGCVERPGAEASTSRARPCAEQGSDTDRPRSPTFCPFAPVLVGARFDWKIHGFAVGQPGTPGVVYDVRVTLRFRSKKSLGYRDQTGHVGYVARRALGGYHERASISLRVYGARMRSSAR